MRICTAGVWKIILVSIDKTELKPDATLHSELLAELYNFLREREYILGDKDSISQLVKMFKNPPLTARTPVSMKMSKHDYVVFNALLKRVGEALK